jgi:hypothetical protein
MDATVITFRTAFFPVWRLVTVLSSAGTGLALVALSEALGIPLAVPQVLVTVLAAILAAGLVSAAIAYYGVYLCLDGIRCYDSLNIYQFARWGSLEGVRPINFLGLRYLRVRAAGLRRELWVPLFLSDPDGFRKVVVALAGPANPLTQWLEQQAAG